MKKVLYTLFLLLAISASLDGWSQNCSLLPSQIPNFSACFGILTTPISLPVKLISFNGAYQNQKAMLTWVTENEYNFQKFEVERSTNGINFSTVGVVLPFGEEGRKANYEFPDNLSSVRGNIFYYRLKMVDRDGKFEYSNTFFIRRDAKTVITINLSQLRTGIYTLQSTNGNDITNSKFTVIR